MVPKTAVTQPIIDVFTISWYSVVFCEIVIGYFTFMLICMVCAMNLLQKLVLPNTECVRDI